jgi:N utilization substance protein A
MINKEFFTALDLLEKDKRISKEIFMSALEAGLATAYKKEFSEARDVTVKLNPEKSMIKVYAYQTVVEEVIDEDKEIALEDAQAIKGSYKVGDRIFEDITPKNFSRIAAQTAKQVIMQRLNDAKKEMMLGEMKEKGGEILNSIIRRIDGGNIYVEILSNQMQGFMRPADQIRGEKYNINDTIKVYVKKVNESSRDMNVFVSRSAAGFVRRLFELEVPEIKAGLVSIKGIVREAGYRTKIAVASEDSNVDAVGSCIGPKGSRINAIVAEINGEKVDVINWCSDPLEYVARALSPAKVVMVQVNDDKHSVKVIVPDDKLSLAIGKEGLNAKLAARLTEWKIDIKPQSSISEQFGLDLLDHVGENLDEEPLV